jgi:hypothetical protein
LTWNIIALQESGATEHRNKSLTKFLTSNFGLRHASTFKLRASSIIRGSIDPLCKLYKNHHSILLLSPPTLSICNDR